MSEITKSQPPPRDILLVKLAGFFDCETKLRFQASHKGIMYMSIKSLSILIPAFVAMGLRANAAMESYTENYGSSSAPWVVADAASTPYTDFPNSVGLPKFNPAQGTLTEIILTLTSTFIAGSEIYNSTSSSQTFQNATADDMTVKISGPYGLNTSGTFSTGTSSGVVGPSSFTHVASVSGSFLDSSVNVPASAFGQFTGSGFASVTLSAPTPTGTYSGSAAPGVFFGGFADSFGSLKVEYIYSAVPEPGTYWAGLTTLGFCLLRLARSRSYSFSFFANQVKNA